MVGATQSDSIQCLNFAKKMIHSIIWCNIALLKIQFKMLFNSKKNSADSIQKIIQFNSQGIINTGRMGKVPKNCPKSVQNRQKRGLFIKNGKYRFKIWFFHLFHDKIQFEGLFNITFSGIFNSKDNSITFFPGKLNSKTGSKIWFLLSIQQNIHSIKKTGYRTPLVKHRQKHWGWCFLDVLGDVWNISGKMAKKQILDWIFEMIIIKMDTNLQTIYLRFVSTYSAWDSKSRSIAVVAPLFHHHQLFIRQW